MALSHLLTERQLADRLSLSVRTLQAHRQIGGGIPFIKIGRSVRYDWAQVQTHLDRQQRTSTSQTDKDVQGGAA